MGKKISVTRKHSLPLDVATQKLGELSKQFAEKYNIQFTVSGQTVDFKRSGVEGEARVTADSVTISLELGLLLGALSGKIEDGVRAQLEKHFA